MDPNLFRIDWDRTFEVLAAIVILSFVIERALSLVFEHRRFIERLPEKGVKEPIAFVVALAVCWFWDFDAVSMIVLRDTTHEFGYFITAGVVAGGSKGSIKLFRDILEFKSTAYADYEAAKKAAKAKPEPPQPGPTHG